MHNLILKKAIYYMVLVPYVALTLGTWFPALHHHEHHVHACCDVLGFQHCHDAEKHVEACQLCHWVSTKMGQVQSCGFSFQTSEMIIGLSHDHQDVNSKSIDHFSSRAPPYC